MATDEIANDLITPTHLVGVTAATGGNAGLVTPENVPATLSGVQRTLATWLLRSEQLRINTRLSSLAYRDGWDAFYNPGDPDSYVLTGGKYSALRDLLGSQPNLVQATDAARPTVATAFTLPMMSCSGAQRLDSGTLSAAPIAQPFSVSTGLRLDDDSSGARVAVSFGDTTSLPVRLTKGTTADLLIWAGSGTIVRNPTTLTALNFYAGVFNGASSKAIADSGTTNGTTGANAMHRINLGGSEGTVSTSGWVGLIGPLAIRFDADDAAVGRMNAAIYAALTETL